MNPDRKIKFPFGVVAANNPLKDNRKRLLLSDFKRHSVKEIYEDGLGSIVGEYDNPGFDDGPTQCRLIHSPVGIAWRGSSVYIAEHFTDRQGCIPLIQYLAGLKEFQSIWHLVSKAFGMVSKKRDGQTQRNQMKRRISKLLMLKIF